MSITLTDVPTINRTTTPYRPLFVDCSSDDGFIVRVIADVYVEGVYETTVEKEPILGETDQFRIEVADMLHKYITPDFNIASSFLEAYDDVLSSKEWNIVIYEVVSTPVTGVLTTTWAEDGAGTGGTSSGSSRFVFNGVNQHLQTIESRYADGTDKKFLTNRPQNSNIIDNEIYMCGILPISEGNTGELVVAEYDGRNGTGSLLATTNSNIGTATNFKLSFTMDASQFQATTKSIVYFVQDTVPNQLTESFTVNVISDCEDVTTIYWQNHWGDYDSYTFTGNIKQKTKTTSKTIDNRLDLSYNSYDRGTKDIKKINSREYEIFTNTTNPDVIEWLAEIGESVDVFVMDGTDRVGVNVKSVAPNIENKENAISQISIKYTLSNERINQLG